MNTEGRDRQIDWAFRLLLALLAGLWLFSPPQDSASRASSRPALFGVTR